MSPHCSPRLRDYVSCATWRHVNMRALFLRGGGCLLSPFSSRGDNTQHSGVYLQENEWCFYFPHALFIINKAKITFVTVGFPAAMYIKWGHNELFGCSLHLFWTTERKQATTKFIYLFTMNRFIIEIMLPWLQWHAVSGRFQSAYDATDRNSSR